MIRTFLISTTIISTVIFTSCNNKTDNNSEEQITIDNSPTADNEDSLGISVNGNDSMKQIASYPRNVILTGLNNHRLVSIYKLKQTKNTTHDLKILRSYDYEDDDNRSEYEHFMPGIDILYGFNLLNIAHYDLSKEKLNFFFEHPVLIKTLYYPSFNQDSINKKPINRDYYMISVYNEDTNHDSLINKKDLRHFFLFDQSNSTKTQIIPADYSVIRSQYDSQNDNMYIFARKDLNKNGQQDNEEPIHIFWFNLKTPGVAKQLY